MADDLTWYHTLDLPGGQVTEGIFDLRPYVDRYGLPERLDGKRALEIGTWDGFWAFELERRGAQVVALDLDDESALDWPARRRPAAFPDVKRGQGFARAKELLGSSVERRVLSVYDATPEELGTFDVVFCGSVLIHLRDQVLALERIAALCDDLFISAEEYDRSLDLLPMPAARYRADREQAVVFWLPNRRAWKRMIWGAGFNTVTEHGRFTMKARDGWGVRHVVTHGRKSG
jgi:tRNA (mo5U34)-methyltransferase